MDPIPAPDQLDIARPTGDTRRVRGFGTCMLGIGVVTLLLQAAGIMKRLYPGRPPAIGYGIGGILAGIGLIYLAISLSRRASGLAVAAGQWFDIAMKWSWSAVLILMILATAALLVYAYITWPR